MASLDKTSVRNEVSRLKADFARLRDEGKVPHETHLLMNSMLMILELMLSIFLERTTQKASRNSSLPSSQTAKDDSSLSQPGSHGKGKAEKNDQARNTRVKETVRLAKVSLCEVCGEDLTGTPCLHLERRTQIDIVFEKVVTHVDAQVKRCPVCEATTQGSFPANMPGPLQYGDGLKAFVINLLVCQMMALKRVQTLVNAMIGAMLSEATLLAFVLRLHRSLEGWEKRAKAQLLNAPAWHVDETSLRVDKQNYWIHSYSAGDITLKFLHRKRGTQAIEAIDLIPRYGGVIIHDCWASYLSYDHCGHGLCGAHLLRELTFIMDSNDYTWAGQMKRLLQETRAAVSQTPQKRLGNAALARLQRRYRTILTQGEKELPPIPVKPSGQRGKLAKSAAHNLLERLREHEVAVLLFAKDPYVAFTNNRAERDLRMAKVKQKVSGCFRDALYAHAYCRISSYLQTMTNQGHNPLIAIQMALAGEVGGE